jgi:hypothetical protein
VAISGNQHVPEEGEVIGAIREARGGDPKAIFHSTRGPFTPKVEERRCETDHVKLCMEVDGGVAKQVAACRARV